LLTVHAPSLLYTLSLHDALPISRRTSSSRRSPVCFEESSRARIPSGSIGLTSKSLGNRGLYSKSSTSCWCPITTSTWTFSRRSRSEEHTSELQSRENLVCRLLLE